MRRILRCGRALDLAATTGPLRHGRDPSWVKVPTGFAKASLTPAGPGVEVITVVPAEGMVVQEAYGPGADWLAERLPDLVGHHDDVAGFAPPPALAEAWRRRPGIRVPRSGLVFEAFVPVVLGQKVTGREAMSAYRELVLVYGEPVGVGPFPGLRVPPAPEVWRAIPSWKWHAAGVGPDRSRTVVAAARRAQALERLVDVPPAQAREAMRSLPGVGVWTAAEVAQRALGDADAISVGDFHVARMVVYALTGRRDGTDEQMLGLLVDQVGHRFRVQRLVEVARLGPDRRGPRFQGRDYRAM